VKSINYEASHHVILFSLLFLVFVMPELFSRYFGLTHPQSVFFPKSKRPSFTPVYNSFVYFNLKCFWWDRGHKTLKSAEVSSHSPNVNESWPQISAYVRHLLFSSSVTGPYLRSALISLRISIQRVLFKFCYLARTCQYPSLRVVRSSALEWGGEGTDPRGLRHRIIPMTSVVRPREKTKGIAL
jgi:hypothetical protein